MYEDLLTTTASLFLNQSELSQTISFLPNDNSAIIFSSPIKSFFKSFSFSFRSYSNLSTIIQFDEIYLNVDIDGYLTLVIDDQQAQRIHSDDEEKPINDGRFYNVQLELNNQTLEASIDKDKKISIELSSSLLFIEKFLFGLHNQFIGCIENVTYNNKIFRFQGLPPNRQECISENLLIKYTEDIQTDRIISFNENDRPVIVVLDKTEKFHMFSLLFYTQEANGIICSLTDDTYENFMILSVQSEYLFLTYYHTGTKLIEISTNNTINDKYEHEIVIKLIDDSYLLFELDGNIMTANMTEIFNINTIYIGKLDSFIKEKFSDIDGEYFIGCIGNVMLNKRSIVKLQHIYQSDRLVNTCLLTSSERK